MIKWKSKEDTEKEIADNEQKKLERAALKGKAYKNLSTAEKDKALELLLKEHELL